MCYKRLLLTLVAGVLMLTGFAGLREEFKANPRMSANNYWAYPDKDLPALTPAPGDYEPFFINHYGRHGSRWLIDPGHYRRPLKVLERAERAGKLTARGKQVLDTLRLVARASHKREGELSDIGAEQHQGIARRMFHNFPQVFAGDAFVKARSTVVIRCILSMQNETDMLKSLNPDLRITIESSKADMYYLNYGDPDIQPLRTGGLPAVDKRRDKWLNPKHMFKRLFNDQRWARDSIAKAQNMLLDLFDVNGNMQSHHDWEHVNMYDLFSNDDILNIYRYNSARWYILSGETPITHCRVDYMQSNLLRNFIEDADRAVDERHRGASLRFGHESVLLPLVCLMGLNGADYQTSDLEHLHEHWQSCRIFPMACNVQMVFFQSATHPDDVLVKVLLNEREATLPVTTDCAPYYHWNDVRNYFLNKLSNIPVIPQAIN